MVRYQPLIQLVILQAKAYSDLNYLEAVMGVKVDYSGKRIGNLYVESESNLRSCSGAVLWNVSCDCGNKKTIRISSKNPSSSCGCLRVNAVRRAIEVDMTNLRFGGLTILSKSDKTDSCGRVLWVGICDCGKECLSTRNAVNSGKISCGCVRLTKALKANTSHGMSNTSIYKRWEQIIQRCTNKNDKNYNNYGGRGIAVCDEWLKFERFYDDIGDVPYKAASIDRINNNKGYYKENCEWADRPTQTTNKRSTNSLGFMGVQAHQGWFRYRLKREGVIYSEAGFLTAKEAGAAYLEKKKEIYKR